MQPFHHLLANNLVANITNFTVWFALTFWTFLETQSVFATGMIAGIYLVLTAMLGIWFGSLVDHHGKRNMMLVSSTASPSYATGASTRTRSSLAIRTIGVPRIWATVEARARHRTPGSLPEGEPTIERIRSNAKARCASRRIG